MGASPEVNLSLIKRNIEVEKYSNLQIVDLGCGKGAVSVKLAQELNCYVLGIDAYKDFIKSAIEYAEKNRVKAKCKFEVGDIRVNIRDLKNFDIAILGSIGHVLGNLTNTLNLVKRSLKNTGFIIIDETYITKDYESKINDYMYKEEILTEIDQSGLKIIDEHVYQSKELVESNQHIYHSIEKRANELILKYPDRTQFFEDYLESQRIENEILENQVKCVTWVLEMK